jgi:hypothetical protein
MCDIMNSVELTAASVSKCTFVNIILLELAT